MNKIYDIIIIGAGAAGLFAAANLKGKKTLIIEKNKEAGIKLLMSGAGRCNITNSCDIKGFLSKYNNEKFMRKILYAYTNKDLLAFFEKRGIEFYTDKNGKVFPKSDKAVDIRNLLVEEAKENRVKFSYNTKVISVEKNENFIVKTNKETFETKKLVIAAGGKSYPTSGSDGDGYTLAKVLGHEIVDVRPALTPITVHDYVYSDFSGLAIQNSKVIIYRENKKVKEYVNDVLFTHKGLSGPGILNISSYMKKGDVIKFSMLKYNNEETFRNYFNEKVEEYSNLKVKNFVKKLGIYEKIADKLFNIDKKVSELSKKEKNNIISKILFFELEISKVEGYNVAMVTAGGVKLDQIDNKTMQSKIVNNLYFLGEVIDIDAKTGGYNLQACFSEAMIFTRQGA